MITTVEFEMITSTSLSNLGTGKSAAKSAMQYLLDSTLTYETTAWLVGNITYVHSYLSPSSLGSLSALPEVAKRTYFMWNQIFSLKIEKCLELRLNQLFVVEWIKNEFSLLLLVWF